MSPDELADDVRNRIGALLCDANPHLSLMLDLIRDGKPVELALIDCLRDGIKAAVLAEDRLLIELSRKKSA